MLEINQTAILGVILVVVGSRENLGRKTVLGRQPSHEHRHTALHIPVITMLPLDWVRSASAWSWRSSSRSRPNVGGVRSPPTPLDVARTTANRGGVAPGLLLHPARKSGGRRGGATEKAISLVRRRGAVAGLPHRRAGPVAIAILQGSRAAPLRSGSGNLGLRKVLLKTYRCVLTSFSSNLSLYVAFHLRKNF